MIITFHGGECCGIKHIKDLSNAPNAFKPALDNERPEKDRQAEPDIYGSHVSSKHNYFYGEAPRETARERLERYIKYLDTYRPNGVIEVTLCDYSSDSDSQKAYDQLPGWEPVLFELGFTLVTSCYNSNSENRIYIYHRKTDTDGV